LNFSSARTFESNYATSKKKFKFKKKQNLKPSNLYEISDMREKRKRQKYGTLTTTTTYDEIDPLTQRFKHNGFFTMVFY